MKIIASKLDVENRRQEYDSRVKSLKDKQDAEYDAYYQARNSVFKPISDYLNDELSKYNLINHDVSVEDTHFGTIKVKISSERRNREDTSIALQWDYSVWLDADGSVQKESGSWSGLQATTQAQLDSLKQTVKCLDFLNGIDWKALLAVELPDYSNYVKTEVPSSFSRPDFESEMLVEDCKEILNSYNALEGKINDNGIKAWFQPVKITDKTITFNIYTDYAVSRAFNAGYEVEDLIANSALWDTRRIKKTDIKKFLIDPAIRLNDVY